jgi:DNA-binding response OmpR family regulator
MPMIFCAGAGVRMNILIVEDSRFLRISNEPALARAGYQVITAADGEEGLRLARENKPDLLILDLMLPKLPGREVLRELRSRPETASIPAMIVSNHLPQANDKKLMEEGATSYFEKAGLMLDKGTDTFVQTVTRMLSQSKAAGA